MFISVLKTELIALPLNKKAEKIKLSIAGNQVPPIMGGLSRAARVESAGRQHGEENRGTFVICDS